MRQILAHLNRTVYVQIVLKVHRTKITGLAFSHSKKVFVSSGADAQV